MSNLFVDAITSAFGKLPWPGDPERKGHLWSSSQAVTCLPLKVEALSSRKAVNTNFIVFGLTPLGIKPVSSISVTDALSIRLLCTYLKRLTIMMTTSSCESHMDTSNRVVEDANSGLEDTVSMYTNSSSKAHI